jgi:hypothetical protein
MSADSPPPTPALLLVAAKSLQSYVLGSDKLREMVGATQLIEDFCSADRAQDYLRGMGIDGGRVITGAAGQLVVWFASHGLALRAAALWPWWASRLAPGLEVHVGVATLGLGYKQALDQCQQQISRSRNRPPAVLPNAAPVHRRNPRSGKVAVATDREPDNVTAWVDAEGHAKRRRRGKQDAHFFEIFGLTPNTTPESFEQITEGVRGDRSYLAVIHADGNGFGKMLTGIGDSVKTWDVDSGIRVFEKVSGMISAIGEAAVREAIRDINERIEEGHHRPKPWLPIVHAGDDLTIVIRADLALDFLVAYLRAFEGKSIDHLRDLRSDHPDINLPQKLTAGGSIVFCKTQHPFSQAYALCESLAASRAKGNRVKDADENARSALVFHRITASTSPTDIENLSSTELSCIDGQTPPLELGCQTWFITDDSEPFNIKNLSSLRDALAEYPSGSRRQLLSDLRTNRSEAGARLARMLKIGTEGGRGGQTRKVAPQRLQSTLAALHGSADNLWSAGDPARSAIPDALVLLETVRSSKPR